MSLYKIGELTMKKFIVTCGLILSVNSIAFADGNAFTPLNFNDTQYGNSAPVSTQASTMECQ